MQRERGDVRGERGRAESVDKGSRSSLILWH